MLYQCEQCGQMHESWPAIGYAAPYQYSSLSEEQKKRYTKKLTGDFCILEYEDQRDYFIRAVLIQEVTDHCENLEYGVWVSLSKSSFEDYDDHYDDATYLAKYFGYLCTWLPGYNDMKGIKTDVILHGDGHRPKVVPWADQHDKEFVRDYNTGISKAEAERRIEAALNG